MPVSQNKLRKQNCFITLLCTHTPVTKHTPQPKVALSIFMRHSFVHTYITLLYTHTPVTKHNPQAKVAFQRTQKAHIPYPIQHGPLSSENGDVKKRGAECRHVPCVVVCV